MMYCKKLDVVFPELDMSRIIGGPLSEGYGETFRSWDLFDLEYFNESISSIIKFNIKPHISTYTEITGNGAAPHSELIQTVLNYYVDPGKCVTFFWKLKDPKAEFPTLPRLTDGGDWVESDIKIYEPSALDYQESFMARPDDVWLLSTGSIHSVSKPATKDIRKFFRLGWFKYSIEEIYSSIEIL